MKRGFTSVPQFDPAKLIRHRPRPRHSRAVRVA